MHNGEGHMAWLHMVMAPGGVNKGHSRCAPFAITDHGSFPPSAFTPVHPWKNKMEKMDKAKVES